MRTLINEKQKHLLCCDEIQDEFLLTKWMEIFRYDKEILKCYCWSRKVFLQLEKTGLIMLENITDDKLYVYKTHQKNLHLLLSMGIHSRRPNLEGVWLKNKKKRLAHDILKPGKLESLNQTIKNYEVTVNGIAYNIKAKSRSQAQYKAWKTHPGFDGKINTLKDSKVRIIKDQSGALTKPKQGV